MGPLQRTPGTAPTAFSPDPPWLRRRERISLVKNRMREICTSGSVRGEAGNILTYSAFLLPQRGEIGGKGRPVAQAVELAKKPQPARRVRVGEPRQEQPPEQAGQHGHW